MCALFYKYSIPRIEYFKKNKVRSQRDSSPSSHRYASRLIFIYSGDLKKIKKKRFYTPWAINPPTNKGIFTLAGNRFKEKVTIFAGSSGNGTSQNAFVAQ